MKTDFTETFNKIMKAYPDASSLVCFTEAVFWSKMTPRQIRKAFYNYVDKKDYKDYKAEDVIKDTFGDIMAGEKVLKNERLAKTLWQ